MNKLTDLNLLYNGFKSSIRGSSWKEEPQRFEIDLLSELVKLSKELENHTYKTSECSEFTLNERGKIRHIHGGRVRDRIVRHTFCDNELTEALNPYLIYNNGASQKKKGISFTRKLFEKDLHNYWLKYKTNEGYIAFVDLSKFYDNIQHDKIKELVYPKIDKQYHWLMDEILKSFEIDVSYMDENQYETCIEDKFNSVKYYSEIPKEQRTGKYIMKKSVNIGDQVSQNIGIFFPTKIDNYVKTVRGIKWYGRYMDDMYIICKDREELKSIINGIKEIANELGLFINDKKTKIMRLSDNYKFLQIKYSLSNTGKVIRKINNKNITRERRRLKTYKRLLDKNKISYENVEQSFHSWIGNYYKIMSKRQIKNMTALYKNLFNKEVKWKQK